jgi:putative membrane protein
MRLSVILAAAIGLALATAIAAYVGFGAVFSALSRVGWLGLAALCAYSAFTYTLMGTAWYVLDEREPLRRWPIFIWSRMVRESAGELLPFSHLGGFIIGARAAVERGISPTAAFATTVVDVTTELLAQLGFTGLGLGLLATRLGAHSTHGNLFEAACVGLGLTVLGAVAFILLQRRGGGLVQRLVERFLPAAAARTERVVEAVNALYRRPARTGAAVLIHLAGWIASAGGIWLALRLAGVRIDFTSALAIESLVATVRTGAFAAPMGIGVQEATYAFVGPLFGLGPELSLAISLLRRGRDLVIGVPVLLAWQGLEGARLLKGEWRDPGAASPRGRGFLETPHLDQLPYQQDGNADREVAAAPQ